MTNTPTSLQTDVLIIGDNTAALGCQMVLTDAGIETITIKGKAEPAQPPFFIGGLVDNFTRLHHAYGAQTAKEVWGFTQLAASWAADQLSTKLSISVATMAKLRLHHSDHQKTEGKEAQQLLKQLGLGSTLTTTKSYQLFPNDLLVHNEQGQGFVYSDHSSVQAKASAAASATVQPEHAQLGTVEQLTKVQREDGSHGYEVTTSAKATLSALMVVITCQRSLIQLRPFYRDVLIPYSDQWQSYDLPPSSAEPAVFYTDHGYVYGYCSETRRASDQQSRALVIGGGRFLLKNARIGDLSGSISPKITEYLHSRAESLTQMSLARPQQSEGFWDTRSCDELPVIGPDFAEPQLLVAGGFMGGGIGIALRAGYELGKLITTGTSATLPRQLWPTRLRTL